MKLKGWICRKAFERLQYEETQCPQLYITSICICNRGEYIKRQELPKLCKEMGCLEITVEIEER